MLAVPGRSERADLVGGVLCCGEPVLGASVGIPEVVCWRAEMVTSSTPELFGLLSVELYALAGPGEFSFLNEDGSLDRSGSLVGDVYLTLPPRDDPGVDGRGEFGRDLSKLALVIGGTLRKAGGDIGCEGRGKSSSCKSESELRLFFLGGPVGMKLGCSPMVVSPFDVEFGEVARSSMLAALRALGPSLDRGRTPNRPSMSVDWDLCNVPREMLPAGESPRVLLLSVRQTE